MTEKHTSADIHIEYTEAYYDGEGDVGCEVTFSSPDIEEKITIDYEGEFQSSIQEQIMEDLMEYLDDPREWTNDYICKGEDTQQKLRVLEREAKSYRDRIESERSLIKSYKGRLKSKEDEIARLRAEMKQ